MDFPQINHGTTLSMEQKLQLEVLKRDIDKLSLEQAKEYLLEAFRQMMIKETLFKDLIKQGL